MKILNIEYFQHFDHLENHEHIEHIENILHILNILNTLHILNIVNILDIFNQTYQSGFATSLGLVIRLSKQALQETKQNTFKNRIY